MSLPTTELFTGLRPTGDLTLANYLGAIKPMVDLQNEAKHITMFVADLHGLTDQEPETVAKYRYEIAADYIALGLNSDKATIFMQSAIKEQVLFMTMFLSRHMSMSEILRVPALKDKLKDPKHPEQATVMLANYPLLMASDILLQGSKTVPVGEDQISHLEVTRLLARRFNAQFGEILIEPQPLKLRVLRVMSLTGDGKMSKSKPNGAILLSDTSDEARKKISRAETAIEGEMNNILESHFVIAHELADDDEAKKLEELKQAHMAGEKVMGQFKELLADLVANFLDNYQTKKQQLKLDDIRDYIKKGNQTAAANAQAILDAVLEATKFNS